MGKLVFVPDLIKLKQYYIIHSGRSIEQWFIKFWKAKRLSIYIKFERNFNIVRSFYFGSVYNATEGFRNFH